mmetsp:Transcript_12173/g.18132  ORF Transcript_12173/g.18132 Transcript_12173/m.18132 type:complete len:130 (+) Transcript_12173:31-420(+)
MGKQATLRTKNLKTNKLFQRKQFKIDITHNGRATLTKAEAKERLQKMYKVNNPDLIFLYEFATGFGGGKTTGFGLIYDNLEACRLYEPKYRLVRQGLATKADSSRKQIKERKNKSKRVRGKARAAILHK